MNAQWRLIVIAALLLGIGHWALRTSTLSWLPLPITVATVLAFTASRTFRYAVPLALVCELLSSLPFGVVTLVIAWPWAIRRLRRSRDPEGWGELAGLVAITVAAQVTTLAAFDWVRGGIATGWQWSELWRYTPWLAMLTTWVASTVAILGLVGLYRITVVPIYERRNLAF